MKRLITFLAASAMLLTAVSCGKKSSSSQEPETKASTVAASTKSKLEQLADEVEEYEIPPFDPRAGIYYTAQPLPELDPVPADWKEMTCGNLSFMVPPDVELGRKAITMQTAKNSDNTVSVSFMDGNDWKANREGKEDSTIDDIYERYSLSAEEIQRIKDEEASREAEAEEEYRELGYPDDDDITEEKTAKYMAAMGFDFDGSQLSRYKALLSMTEKDRTPENAEAFDYLAILKAEMFGMSYPGIYGFEAEGVPVYLHVYPGILTDPRQFREADRYKSLWVGAFAEPDMEYTALIRATSHKEALLIASTIKVTKN